jgi:RecJ-like exonuclease
VSLRDRIRNLSASSESHHQAALTERFEGDDATPIAEATARRRVQISGEVTRIRTMPTSGVPTLEVRISDGTGYAVVVWHGRRALGGMALGHAISVDGVASKVGEHLVFRDPIYTLLD